LMPPDNIFNLNYWITGLFNYFRTLLIFYSLYKTKPQLTKIYFF